MLVEICVEQFSVKEKRRHFYGFCVTSFRLAAMHFGNDGSLVEHFIYWLSLVTEGYVVIHYSCAAMTVVVRGKSHVRKLGRLYFIN